MVCFYFLCGFSISSNLHLNNFINISLSLNPTDEICQFDRSKYSYLMSWIWGYIQDFAKKIAKLFWEYHRRWGGGGAFAASEDEFFLAARGRWVFICRDCKKFAIFEKNTLILTFSNHMHMTISTNDAFIFIYKKTLKNVLSKSASAVKFQKLKSRIICIFFPWRCLWFVEK